MLWDLHKVQLLEIQASAGLTGGEIDFARRGGLRRQQGMQPAVQMVVICTAYLPFEGQRVLERFLLTGSTSFERMDSPKPPWGCTSPCTSWSART